MEALLKGIVSGITVSFLIGPIFFALVELTISKGWRSGLFYIFGVLMSDVVLIYAVETILIQFSFDNIKSHVGLIGGILLIIFGMVTFFAKANIQSTNITNIKTLFQSFLKGVTINIFNPFVTIWWITMYSTISIYYNSNTDKILFYFGILLMVFLFDLLKMRFAYYLKQHLTLNKLLIVKKVVGVCLFIFGVVMIVKVI
jgi:threonine/homoserine/homoserine lactone efflux protein